MFDWEGGVVVGVVAGRGGRDNIPKNGRKSLLGLLSAQSGRGGG